MQIHIPTPAGSHIIELEPGRPVILLGANGTGKTRLGIYIDDHPGSGVSHRIAAQRSLELPDEVLSEAFDKALGSLVRDKESQRRQEQSAVAMSYNYDQLLIALFSEHYRALERAHAASWGKKTTPRQETLIERLQTIWRDLVPHRELTFSEMSVRANPVGVASASYEASQMSDGERVIFYILGQALLIPKNGVLIVDEPELHINRAIVGRLWDAIEKARSDCALIYITHDIDFAVSRRNARRFAVRNYWPPVRKQEVSGKRKRTIEIESARWEIEAIPEGGDIPDEILTRIVGSRLPILFVEGGQGSLDTLIYRQVYDNFTVIPVGSCGQVIQLLKSFKAQQRLHRLHCAGLVDLDGRTVDEGGLLEDGLYALPVSELENVFLLPKVFLALAATLSFSSKEAEARLASLQAQIFEKAGSDADDISLRYTRRLISAKTFGLEANSIDTLTMKFNDVVSSIQPKEIYETFRSRFKDAITKRDYETILRLYDNKGLLAAVASVLGAKDRSALKDLIGRKLLVKERTALLGAVREVLPAIQTDPRLT
jgi:hypothetical protein